jgi:hypothetical protein
LSKQKHWQSKEWRLNYLTEKKIEDEIVKQNQFKKW